MRPRRPHPSWAVCCALLALLLSVASLTTLASPAAADAPGQQIRVFWTGQQTLTDSRYDYAKRLELTYAFSVTWRASWEWDPASKQLRPQTASSVSGTASRRASDGTVLCSGAVTGRTGVPAVSFDKLGNVTFEAAAIPGWAGGGDLDTCYGGLVPPIGVGDVSRQKLQFKAKARLSSLLSGSASASASNGFQTNTTYQGPVCIAGCIVHTAATDGGYTPIGGTTKPMPNPNDPKFTDRAKLTWSSTVSTGTGKGTYVALGDSYSSGEGADYYVAGTADLVNACHRSRLAWPVLVAHELGYQDFDGKPGKDSEFAACSGAVLADLNDINGGVRNPVGEGGPKNLDEPAQRQHLERSNVRLVTLSFGGNDLGFGSVVSDCVKDGVLKRLRDSVSVAAYAQFFQQLLGQLPAADRAGVTKDQGETCQKQHGSESVAKLRAIVPRLITAYRQVADTAPDAKVLVVGYPNFFPAKLGTDYCADTVQRSDVEWASGLIMDFDNAVKGAVASAGRKNLRYVAPSPSWSSHTICDKDTWFVPPDTFKGVLVNVAKSVPGLIRLLKALVPEPGVTTSEFFHPNADGQLALAQAVAAQAR